MTIAPSKSFDCGSVEVLDDLDESYDVILSTFLLTIRTQNNFASPASSCCFVVGVLNPSSLVGGHLRAELGRLFVSAQSLLAARGRSGRAAELKATYAYSAVFSILFIYIFGFPRRFAMIARHQFFLCSLYDYLV